MVMGTNDLAKELNSRFRPDRLPLQAGLGPVPAGRAGAGADHRGRCLQRLPRRRGPARRMRTGRGHGFDGKTLITPAQLDIANAAFAPSAASLTLPAARSRLSTP